VKLLIGIAFFVMCTISCAQNAGFNPLKELQTIPNAARITVSIDKLALFTIDKLPLFNRSKSATIVVDGKRVAEGDSDNPPTFEVEPGKEFVFEVCEVTRKGDINPNYCVFGGVMRPTDNTLYRFKYKISEDVNYIVFLGKQVF